MQFDELCKNRHSAVNFVEGIDITETQLKEIFELVKLSPSVFNLQRTNYLVVTDQEMKQKIKELSYNQYKIGTASAVIYVLADKNGVSMAHEIYEPMKWLGIIDEVEYEKTMEQIQKYTGAFDETGTHIDLVREASISATSLLYAAKHYGWDTCPMGVINYDEIRQLFNIPDNLIPVLMITLGKSVEKKRPRGYRKPVNQFVTFDKF